MNKISIALNYIDDDLIFAALETTSKFKKVQTSGSRINVEQRQSPRLKGSGIKVKAIGGAAAALIACAAFAVCVVVALTGNEAVDIYRLDKEEKILGSFAEIQEYYPDNEVNLSALSFNNMQIGLYYENDSDWRNSENWYSLVFSGYGEAVNADNVTESYTVYCLFTGTVDDWKVSMAFDNNTQYLTIGGVEAQTSYLATVECSYAIFEKNGVVYDIRVQSGDTTNEDLMEVLELLLN
ncbi:MAG: hypothetical protein LUD27_03845 [Clostridia bacterium]|nr:hypothetical protein [Clostridia bacterium]